jgi:hypothetical protein
MVNIRENVVCRQISYIKIVSSCECVGDQVGYLYCEILKLYYFELDTVVWMVGTDVPENILPPPLGSNYF